MDSARLQGSSRVEGVVKWFRFSEWRVSGV